MEREGRRRRHKQHYYQESSGGGHARHGHGERKLKKRGGNPILRMLALDY